MPEALDERGLRPADFGAVFADMPTAYLVLTPDLVILDANRAYQDLLGHARDDLIGRHVFDAFPPSPGALDDQGNNPLQLSFERARDAGQVDRMPLLNYDVVDPVSGETVQRYWSLISAPVLGDGGRTELILQRVEDVTDYVLSRRELESEREQGEGWRRRAEVVEAELFTRAQDLHDALQAQERVTRRLAGLADAALHLAAAETIEDLVETVTSVGLTALGADGGALGVRDDAAGVLRLTLTDSLGDALRQQFPDLPLDDPLPATTAARTGEAVLLENHAATLAWAPAMADVYAATGREAWAALPLRSGDTILGSLITSWAEPHVFDADEVGLLEAFAAQCSQSLARLLVREAEQRAASISREMSESLQRSLLTAPPEPDHLEIVVRYRAAAEQAEIGGDWFDAFLASDGALSLVVGDVTGHDREAAAVMGQIRNLLRGIGYTLGQPPAAVVGAVDHAMRDLDVGALATAILARVEQDPAETGSGRRTMRWVNAGHLPPLLLRADGSAEFLVSEPDLLLGFDAYVGRTDHTQVLEPGDTVLLYTDGLIERRGQSLDVGLEWLRTAAAERRHLDPNQLADALLAEVDGIAEDDIALLLLRTHPENRPRPASAGPGHVPRSFQS